MTSCRILVMVGLSAVACTGQNVPVGEYGGHENGGASDGGRDAPVGGYGPGTAGAPSVGVGAVVGPEGATVESKGVRLIIPPGALQRDVEITLSVDEGGHTISVSPDLVLSAPARVEVPWSDFVPGDPVLYLTEDGASYETATVARDDDGVYYESDQLTAQQVRKREVVVGCWEQGWNRRLAPSGEDCSGSPVGAPTICESVFPTLVETSASSNIWEEEVFQARRLSTTSAGIGRQTDVRVFTDVVWHANPVSTVFGSCASDDDCEGSGYRVDGECVDGSCRFERDPDEAYLMAYPAAVALAFAGYTMQTEMPEYSILVRNGIDTSGRFHSAESLHYVGRAVDVSLWNVEQDREATQDELDENLPRLAPILLRSTFSWVWFESAKHLHASIIDELSCMEPYERCSCDAPTVEADPSNLTCQPTSGGDDCPPCLPQHFSCDSGLPPVEGCISNGRHGPESPNRYCCPALPAEFPCVPADPALHHIRPDLCERSTVDGNPAPYFYSCADAAPPDCYPTGGAAILYCNLEWYVASDFCCSRPY